jgi:predicted nucleic acid-binding protein
LIFLDTNVISETLRKTPNPAVIAWLVRNDAELALPIERNGWWPA